MRVGIITPIVILLPRSHNQWEVDASVEDLVEVAQAADRFGYHHLTASEHIAIPVDVEARRGMRYWDLLSTLSYLAACTQSIRLATNMVVLPYHHPLEVVKHYGTLDRLSGGRLVLGVGVGSLREEFDLLGKGFEGRGDRADDALRAIRASWGRREPQYDGEHYAFRDVVVDPTGVQDQPPVWVGGRTPRSLRRALELGDAWVPFLLGPDEVRSMLDRAMATPTAEARTRPLDVALWPEPALDVLGEAARVREQAEEHLAAGATILNYRFPSRSLAHHLEQMEALTEVLDLSWDT
ncbi:MAG TPA: LLM class F420-dependent oxidoreductase [Acidimicrobiales bacterium]|nr:LLM class F420-dependent oxidoreductase [Acidimicrobiales bacterium]